MPALPHLVLYTLTSVPPRIISTLAAARPAATAKRRWHNRPGTLREWVSSRDRTASGRHIQGLRVERNPCAHGNEVERRYSGNHLAGSGTFSKTNSGGSQSRKSQTLPRKGAASSSNWIGLDRFRTSSSFQWLPEIQPSFCGSFPAWRADLALGA